MKVITNSASTSLSFSLIAWIFLCPCLTIISKVDAFHVVTKVNQCNSNYQIQIQEQQQFKQHNSYQLGTSKYSFNTPLPHPAIRKLRNPSSLSVGKADGEGMPPSINIPLILQNLASQALIGSTIFAGGAGYRVLSEQAHFDTAALASGIIGVIPLITLSRFIETSESPFVSGLNLSTNMAVLRMFGSTPKPVSVFLVSIFMSFLTGVVEETTFRGQSLPAFANAYGNGDILVGAFLSTLLFAVLHTNPAGFFKGREAFVDNFALLNLQLVNGGTFAALYLITGNLAVSIITHALYDFYTFYKTHLVDVAGQMTYAKEKSLMPICSSKTVENKWIMERGEDWLLKAKQSFYLADTNRDGGLSRKELRIALYPYGINLSKVESQIVKQVADIDVSGSIDFDEYLEYIGPTGSRSKAVRNTLLGPIFWV